MRKLSWILLGLFLAVWAQQILRNPEFDTLIALRDGLVLSVLAGLIFASTAPCPPEKTPDNQQAQWPLTGRVLYAAGIILGLSGGLLMYLRLDPSGGGALSVPLGLWLLGMLLLAVGALWPDRILRYRQPSARWSVDAAGRFIRMALASPDRTRDREPFRLSQRTILVSLAGITILAALFRLLNLTNLPPGCSNEECTIGLDVLNWLEKPSVAGLFETGSPLYTLWVAGFYVLYQPGLATLRWASALIGVITVPVVYAAASRLFRPATGLLAALLLALSPWHIRASRSVGPELLLVLCLFLVIWAGAWVRVQPERRRWAVLGLLSGIAANVTLMWPVVLVWALSLFRERRPGFGMAYGILGTATIPVFVASIRLHLLPDGVFTAFGARTQAAAVALFRQSSLLGMGMLSPALLTAITGALFVLGLVYGLRYLRWLPATLSVSGLVFFGIFMFSTPETREASGMDLVALLPFVYLAAFIALDRLLFQTGRIWSEVLRPPAIVATVALLLVGFLGWQSAALLSRLHNDPAVYNLQNLAQVRLGQYLSDALAAGAGQNLRIFVPPADLNHPATRLAARSTALASDALRPLDPSRDIPYTGPATRDLLYILPGDKDAVAALLRQVYLGAPLEEIRDERFGQLLFSAYRVPAETAQQIQGLPGLYFRGTEFGTAADAILRRRDGPLRFDWSALPPAPPPFTAEWRGSLLVPQFGEYVFSVDAGDGIFSLELDDALVLDTSLGLTEQRRTLAQGLYRLEMRYRSGELPEDLAVHWQRPSGETEIIPRDVLYNLALPTAGLLGTYYAGDHWDGPILTQRRDLILEPDPTLPQPYSVEWIGKLAASDSGEYILALSTDGVVSLEVDGQLVLQTDQSTQDGLALGFVDGAIFLAKGWHDLRLRYRPGSAQPDIHLLWQPPGRNLDEIDNIFLAPLPPDAATDNLTLPVLPAPPVVASPGGTPGPRFAEPPANAIPPTDLPILPVEGVWQVGDVCAGGDEQFNQPRGVAIDPLSGQIYIADAGNRRIVVRSLEDGALLHVYTGDVYQEPFDLDMGPTGELYLLDAVAQQIFRLDQVSGAPQLLPTETAFYRPRGMDVSVTGDVLIADTGGARAVLLTSMGQVVNQFGGPDTPLGAGQPVDVLASANGIIWLVTAEDGRLWRLDTGQGFAAVAPSNTFDAPHLAGLPDSRFFLTDPERQLVFLYDPFGQPLGQFGGPDKFIRPVGVSAARIGDQVYIAVSDSPACAVSLWRAPVDGLPSLP